MKPISPDDVAMLKLERILPDYVIEAFNEEIAKNYSSGSSVVKINNVVDRILSKNANIDRKQIFENKYLEVDDVYREAGWTVNYDRPGYNESYEANWTFRRKKC